MQRSGDIACSYGDGFMVERVGEIAVAKCGSATLEVVGQIRALRTKGRSDSRRIDRVRCKALVREAFSA